VREAVENTLSAREQKDILRFRVPTPEEYNALIGVHNGKGPKRIIRKASARKPRAAGTK
jgi:hypothetical protein